jgi:hypothetical protein
VGANPASILREVPDRVVAAVRWLGAISLGQLRELPVLAVPNLSRDRRGRAELALARTRQGDLRRPQARFDAAGYGAEVALGIKT